MTTQAANWRATFGFDGLNNAMNSPSQYVEMDGAFFSDGTSRTITFLSAYSSNSILGANHLEMGGDAGIIPTFGSPSRLNNPDNLHIIVGYPDGVTIANPVEPALLHPLGRFVNLDSTSTEQFRAFITSLGSLDSSPRLWPITISDDSLIAPLGMSGSTGAVSGSARLKAPTMSARKSTGVVAGSMDLRRPLVIPATTRSTGAVSGSARLKAPTMSARKSAGAVFGTAQINPGLRLSIQGRAGPVLGRCDLKPPPLIASGSAGPVNGRLTLQALPLIASGSAGPVNGSCDLKRPLFLHPRGSTEPVNGSCDLAAAKNIPLIVKLGILPVEGRCNLKAPTLSASHSTGPVNGSMNLQVQKIRIDPKSSGVPHGNLTLVGGINAPQFRTIPNYTAFRRRQSNITLPRVTNESASGRYELSGLPDGLTYDASIHALVGTVTDDAGDYTITMTYIE